MLSTVKTNHQTEFVDITAEVRDWLTQHAPRANGMVFLFVPHTTAAITINENADPTVPADMLMVLNQMVPENAPYRHREGNSPAHVKATLVGASEMVAVEQGRLVLGTWQGIFFCEFDGPRTRKLHLRFLSQS